MPQTHLIAVSARAELLRMLHIALDPLITSDTRERQIRDCIELIEEDNVRSGYYQRFMARVVRQGEHMIWTGAGQDAPDGRPICNFEGKRVYAAKVLWFFTHYERVPDDETLAKRCKVPRCIGPRCHVRVLRADAVGRPPAVRRDEAGRPLCKRGHLLKREPRPREHIYCAACERQKTQDFEAAERARAAVEAHHRREVAPLRPTPIDAPEYAPGEESEPTPARTARPDWISPEVEALFDL